MNVLCRRLIIKFMLYVTRCTYFKNKIKSICYCQRFCTLFLLTRSGFNCCLVVVAMAAASSHYNEKAKLNKLRIVARNAAAHS